MVFLAFSEIHPDYLSVPAAKTCLAAGYGGRAAYRRSAGAKRRTEDEKAQAPHPVSPAAAQEPKDEDPTVLMMPLSAKTRTPQNHSDLQDLTGMQTVGPMERRRKALLRTGAGPRCEQRPQFALKSLQQDRTLHSLHLFLASSYSIYFMMISISDLTFST